MSFRAEEEELGSREGMSKIPGEQSLQNQQNRTLGTHRDFEHLYGSEVDLCIWGMVKHLGVLVGILRVGVGVVSDALICS